MPTEDLGLILARLTQDHREELARAHAQLVFYRKFIEDNGLIPPDPTGEEALMRFRHVFEIAGFEDDWQHPELMADWWMTNIVERNTA